MEMNCISVFWSKLLELHQENTSFNSLQPDTYYSTSLLPLPKTCIIIHQRAIVSPWQASSWMILSWKFHLLLKACSTQQRAAVVKVKSWKFHFQSLEEPLKGTWDLQRTGQSLLLPPVSTQDISSDGGVWRKGLCRVQWTDTSGCHQSW